MGRQGISRACCPDCGETTPFGRETIPASKQKKWVISKELVNRLYESLAAHIVDDPGREVRSKNPKTGQIEIKTNAKSYFVCSKCRSETKVPNWIEADEHKLFGPFCNEHLKELLTTEQRASGGRIQELTIYTISYADNHIMEIVQKLKPSLANKDLEVVDPFSQF